MELKKIKDLHKIVNQYSEKKKLVLCSAEDEHALEAVIHAFKEGIIEPILVGEKPALKKTAQALNFDLNEVEVHFERDTHNVVKKSVMLVMNGEADILMKGQLSTAKLLSGVLNKDWGLKTKRFLSHLAIFEVPKYHKLIAMTDVAMNILPTLNHKIGIINNAVSFLKKLGSKNPKDSRSCSCRNG